MKLDNAKYIDVAVHGMAGLLLIYECLAEFNSSTSTLVLSIIECLTGGYLVSRFGSQVNDILQSK